MYLGRGEQAISRTKADFKMHMKLMHREWDAHLPQN